jgi:pyruvate dehydrogenase E2 component (dihydrolipoamide acetyltransferase)
MPTEVPMPELGLTMEEATVLEWLVADGSLVEADQPIVLIETDKTESEVVSPGSGRLHQVGRPGEVFPCGARIALLFAEGEHVPTPTAAPAEGRILASPNARRVAAERGVQLSAVRGTGPGGRIVADDVLAVPAGTQPSHPREGLTPATFAARTLADLLGVDLAEVPVDPVERRVTREGVAAYVRALLQQLVAPPATTSSIPTQPDGPVASIPLLQRPSETLRLSGMRGTIAKRMHASLQEMAQLTLTMDAEMAAVLADRAARADGATAAPTITDYVVAATARALTMHPRLNAQVTAEGINLLPGVHVGLAVAVENGLLVPVVRDAARLSLAELAAETKRLADAARGGQLAPAELEGGTFSVSSLGSLGVDTFTPVINPPNAGILGVGRLRDDVVVGEGGVTTTKRLTLSLTWDHRVLDGVPAAEFCRTIVALLAAPDRLDR